MENKEDAQLRYGSFLQQMITFADPTNVVVVGGRGVAKSTVVIAHRTLECVRLMPGAPVCIVANTYANLVDNIMPAVQNGWRLQGLIEGVHYVKGVRPPEEWKRRCSCIVDDYRHVYTFWNGSVIFLGSLDNPSLTAGKSVAHLVFDETKYASDAKAARVLPILRGDAITYGRCHLYGGVTITTDMPDIMEGEYDWFFRYAAEMDPERIVAIVQAFGELNRLRMQMLKAEKKEKPDPRKIARLEKKIRYNEEGLNKLRKGQTLFMNVSSLVNIDVLTVEYAERLYNGALEPHEFMKSVLGCRPGLRKDARFYVLFGDDHKYDDGTRSGVAAFSSSELRYLDPSKPLEGGMDFGKMMSLVIGQEQGPLYRVLKNFYILPPEWLPDLARDFREFFASHPVKELRLWYDRSGNNLQSQNQDYARQIKEAIEHDADGKRTGWTVTLMSRKQRVLLQEEEFNFMHTLMKGENPSLPKLLIDVNNCSELISSLEGARAGIKYRGEQKIITKIKKSEKLAVKKLPRLSTNLSDAFKYLLMRKHWMDAVKARRASAPVDSTFLEEWMRNRKSR
ncbi:MAG: hypothetical protein HDS97_06280 [Bacteroidales bacterium]|nr:hypothetical protein [Bacteroidales bacterium]